MQIGIPNRSSFLHAGAVVQCIAAELLPWSEYHAVKLFYHLPSNELLLCRCDDLCKLFCRGDLEVIFIGDDYAQEYLRDIKYESIPFAFIKIKFALLCAVADQNYRFNRLFTKYPQVAKESLARWGISSGDINVVSGASECFASCIPLSAAFDVMCTSATQQGNKLHAIYQGDSLGCSWYFRRGTFPVSLAQIVANNDMFARLQNYYQTVLYSRDVILRDTIGALLNISNRATN